MSQIHMRWNTENGLVQFVCPPKLPRADLEDLKEVLTIQLRLLERRLLDDEKMLETLCHG